MIFRSQRKGTRTILRRTASFMLLSISHHSLQDMARGISKHSWNIHVKAQAHEACRSSIAGDAN